MPRATEILLLVMLPPVQPWEGMGNFLSFPTTRQPYSSAIMKCTTKAVNVTHHELVEEVLLLSTTSSLMAILVIASCLLYDPQDSARSTLALSDTGESIVALDTSIHDIIKANPNLLLPVAKSCLM